MDDSAQAALRAIIRALVSSAPDIILPDALTQSLYEMETELQSNSRPAEARDVGRLATFAGELRNARLNRR
ncbi:hypothetical protein [Sphingobium indicum]|uniref:hypothetical protein n=1 Tax=Sphingobium indicum TaxID=332055 RepID=UPI00055BC319|nr:hypothetical protein [Sphingobium indicum]